MPSVLICQSRACPQSQTDSPSPLTSAVPARDTSPWQHTSQTHDYFHMLYPEWTRHNDVWSGTHLQQLSYTKNNSPLFRFKSLYQCERATWWRPPQKNKNRKSTLFNSRPVWVNQSTFNKSWITAEKLNFSIGYSEQKQPIETFKRIWQYLRITSLNLQKHKRIDDIRR